MTTFSSGIKAWGAFIPRLRMARSSIAHAHAWAFPQARGSGEKAFCNWDEDAITLAVEAARDCLGTAGTGEVKNLMFASTTAPFADLCNASLIASALRLPSQLCSSDLGGSIRAGLSALADRLSQPQSDGDQLLLASERRAAKPASPQEQRYGCGAAALLVGHEDLAARFLGREASSTPFTDHFRHTGEQYDYYWEERWIRDEGIARQVPTAVRTLLERLNISAEQVAYFGLAGGPPGSDTLVAKTLGIPLHAIRPTLSQRVGDTGTAHAPLLLVDALEHSQPGDIIVIAAFAQGCEVVAFERQAGGNAPDTGLQGSIDAGVVEPSYLKMLSFDNEVRLDWGPRAEIEIKAALSQLHRSSEQIFGFVGGQCSTCGTVQFPSLVNCVNCCASDTQAPAPLADCPAKLATWSADWLMYYPSPPLYVGLVQFDNGARVLMEVVDVDPEGLDVGTPLRMALRVKARDSLRHFDRYFWKAVPVQQPLSKTVSVHG